MKAFAKGILLLLIVASITGCSRKKNTFLNRNWHAVTAEYNTLYNGNLALELGKEELNQTYNDNFWEILPVERMQMRETITMDGEGNPNFEVAEEKAVKAIQRHSMLIEGRERNPQIDEAYLLLGKARYYEQGFVPALEAFNFILQRYPLSNNIIQAQIWREKTNMRLEFNELAIRNLKRILKQEQIEKQETADASAMLAQAYLNITARDSALSAIKRAAELTGDNEEKGRYLFIKGQLYNRLGFKDSANIAFEEVIDLNRKTPRVYHINAHIEKIRNLSQDSETKAEMLEMLTDLARDRENRPFLDKLYFELAEFHYMRDSIGLAVDYYNRSLREPSQDLYLQSLDYETLGNIHFEAANYQLAGAYYDSTLTRLPENSREFRLIRKKTENLEDVIYYEEMARTADSILYLTELSEEEQLSYFTEYTEELKTNVSVANATEATTEEVNYFENKRPGMPGVPNPGNAFYFYNPTAVAYGKQEFFRQWGNRALADNWRSGGGSTSIEADDASVLAAVTENNPIYDPQTYISQIPKDSQTIDSLSSDRNFAWYQLGLIYRNKFGENALAAEKLEMLLDHQPEERLVLPAKYNLYKIYTDLGEISGAQSVKNDILFRHPDSRYAAILKNPGSVLNEEDDPTVMYDQLFKLYEDQEYEKVINEADQLTNRFTGDEIVPKLELLKAVASGRLRGYDAYRENLNYVALNYPQTEEGRKAQQLLKDAIPAMADMSFKNDSIASSFKLIFPFEKQEHAAATDLREDLIKIIEDLEYSYLDVSLDVYDPNQIFLVVHGFTAPGRVEGFAKLLSTSEKYNINKNSFYISSPNYRVAQIHKNINTYLNSN